MYKCNICGFESEYKDLFMKYYGRKAIGRSEEERKPYCKGCSNKWKTKDTALSRTRIRDIIKEKKAVPCSDCGIEYPYYVMDFDHVKGEKSFGIGSSPRIKVEDLLKEIDKCEVVCSNCHRKRTYEKQMKKGL